MGMNLLLLVCMYPVLPIMYVAMRGEVNRANRYIYGVTIPVQNRNKEDVKVIQKKYNKMLNRLTLLLLFVPFIIFWIPYFSINFSILMIWMLVVIIVLAVPYALGNKALKKLKRQQSWLQEEYNYLDDYNPQEAIEPDDDDQWVYGMFYYNPQDKKTMVNKRAGIGTTMNMARPAGKIVMAFVLVSLLSIPGVCVWLCMEEFTGIDVRIENQTVIASHIRENYRLPLDQIESVEVIDTLPHTYKKNGTSMDNLKKGTFTVEGYGACELLLNPNNNKFLVIVMLDETVILSDTTDEETMDLYEELKQEQK